MFTVTLSGYDMYEYKCKLIKVVDGDTVDAMIDLGFNTWVKKRIRLHGIDCPEVRTRNKIEKAKGMAAKYKLEEILDESSGCFNLVSHGVGKYGRCIGEIRGANKSVHGLTINETLVKEGHAKKSNWK